MKERWLMSANIKVSPLLSANCVVPDAAAAIRTLGDIFNAPELPVPADLFLEQVPLRAAGMGDLTIIFADPLAKDAAIDRQLAEKGGFFHSLTYEVDDLERCRSLMAVEGIYPSALGADDASGISKSSLFFDTSARIGFALKLIQAESERSEWGAGAKRIPAPHGDLSPLLHIELVTEDMDDVQGFLNRIFGTERIEVEFAEFLTSFGVLEVVHMGLGDTVLQYCRPIVEGTSWEKLLQRRGRCVHNVTWLVQNMAETYYAYRGLGFDDLMDTAIPFGLLFGDHNVPSTLSRAHIMNSIETLGFGIELTENFADNMNDYLHNPIFAWRDSKAYTPRTKPFTNSRVTGTNGIV